MSEQIVLNPDTQPKEEQEPITEFQEQQVEPVNKVISEESNEVQEQSPEVSLEKSDNDVSANKTRSDISAISANFNSQNV